MKKQEKPFILIGAAFFIFLLYLLTLQENKMKLLKSNIEYTNAVILDFSSGPRGRHYLDYVFLVNGTNYHGSGKHYPNSDTLSKGNSIVIVYDKTNPDNNKPERDFIIQTQPRD